MAWEYLGDRECDSAVNSWRRCGGGQARRRGVAGVLRRAIPGSGTHKREGKRGEEGLYHAAELRRRLDVEKGRRDSETAVAQARQSLMAAAARIYARSGGCSSKRVKRGVARCYLYGGSGPQHAGPGWHGEARASGGQTRIESGPSTRWGTPPTGGPHLAAREEGEERS